MTNGTLGLGGKKEEGKDRGSIFARLLSPSVSHNMGFAEEGRSLRHCQNIVSLNYSRIVMRQWPLLGTGVSAMFGEICI